MLGQMTLPLDHRVRSLMTSCNLRVITKTLPNCQVIFLKPILQVDNGKAVLTLHYLNENFSELSLDVANKSKIKVKYISQKCLHFSPMGKGRLALNFILKTRGP